MSAFDLSDGLPAGPTYTDAYGQWLEIFRCAAEEESVTVTGAPRSWVPLLLYLGCSVNGSQEHFPEDRLVHDPEMTYSNAREIGRQREYVEMVSTLRPETIDALWKSDAQWTTATRDHTHQQEFVIGSYGSFWRPELMEYFERLRAYRKPESIRNALITNCSADKPYPADLHKRLGAMLPDDSWHLVIATGVLGVVPSELWDGMPLYDSGVPNFWRCMTKWEEYLSRNEYDRLVVYTEFYSPALARALASITSKIQVDFILPVGYYSDYLDLLDADRLQRLESALHRGGT